jgi:hypothetical protein
MVLERRSFAIVFEHRFHNYKVRKNRHSHLQLQRTLGLERKRADANWTAKSGRRMGTSARDQRLTNLIHYFFDLALHT